MKREEMIRLLVGVQEGLPGAGRRWATLENVIRALESEEVVAGWAREKHLEVFRSKEIGTLLLGAVRHYDDDVLVRILAAKGEGR